MTEVRSSIEETSEDISNFNRKQLFEGTRSTGTEIKPFYSPYTILLKDQKGQPTDRVTLKDTGDFYNSIQVDVKTDSYDIIATDYKYDKLANKYGKTILGLNVNNKTQYIFYSFFPALRERITKKLEVKFG